jgi:hypothetical protein
MLYRGINKPGPVVTGPSEGIHTGEKHMVKMSVTADLNENAAKHESNKYRFYPVFKALHDHAKDCQPYQEEWSTGHTA